MIKYDNIMEKIIEEKYSSLGLDNKNKANIFWKITEFEANAIGQIGEKFIKEIFEKIKISFEKTRDHIHDEYDIILKNGKKIEIKTARKGKKNNTFQFNGLNPRYNCNFIILLGIMENSILYKIINKDKQIKYVHKTRKYIFLSEDIEKTLVPMNPQNQASYKLTLNKRDMIDISEIERELILLKKIN